MSNEWIVEGNLTKRDWVKEGTTKAGKPYMIDSISVYAGKDKETGKTKYENISFFVKPEDQETFRSFKDGQKIRLKGRPQASSYTDKKTGDIIQKLNIQLAWEDGYELIGDPQQDSLLDDEDLPF